MLGGVDCTGPSLYTVYPHGSTDSLPYVTMGSGSLAAMAIFESEYKSKMTLEEAKALVHSAIMAGINNDLGSGCARAQPGRGARAASPSVKG